MSSLVLIRHGQARPFEANADSLSERGEWQARQLGQWWRRHGVHFDVVISGALFRHEQTARLAGFRSVIADPRWNEYDAPGLLARAAPRLAAEDEEFAELFEAAQRHQHTPEANRYFQRMFEVLMNRWLGGGLAGEDFETWPKFAERVRQALREIQQSSGSGTRIAVFTSGGPIAVVVQTVLQAPENKALEINWRIRNSSLTEFLFTRERMSLDLFNATPHLEPSEITYR
ncbi:MAG: histidine phosphatase family protein [Bryobacteraceae bacterium]|nr:histidine phosphatase family protein [Bryobacteraceae bacterium]MDW8377573.1 histidine phosphatase family protein [Bryobacterales bacterium]